MERFEPASTSAAAETRQHLQRHRHDYSYAYFEPHVEIKQNEGNPRSIYGTNSSLGGGGCGGSGPLVDVNTPGPSQAAPTRNSIRALLSTTNRNGGLIAPASTRHMYANRYGTHENIYEEIGAEERIRILTGGQSMVSLNQSMVEEEFRRVQNRHRRILGELNLSVEAMLMPSTPPSDSPTEEESSLGTATVSSLKHLKPDKLEELLQTVEPTDELLSPVSAHASAGVGDLDSGFSGSSSGASYVGSLRYRAGSSATRSSTPNGVGQCNNSVYSYNGSIRSSQRSHEDPGCLMSFSSRYSSSFGSGSGGKNNKIKSAEDPGPPRNNSADSAKQKTSFWSRKGWRRLPGFSSTTSVHKAGLLNGKF